MKIMPTGRSARPSSSIFVMSTARTLIRSSVTAGSPYAPVPSPRGADAMATPPTLDLDDLLAPIPGPNPSGRSLAYEPEYDVLREARRAEDDTLQGDWQRKAKVAEWDRVIDLGTDDLRRLTKDLQIAAWVAEALARRRGFAGLRDGLRLLRGLIDGYWPTCYPEVDDGDLEARAAALASLNQEKLLPLLIRSLPLTDDPNQGHYSFLRWQESRATDNAGLKNPELMQALIADGKITAEQFDTAVAQSPRSFYEALVADQEECRVALLDLEQLTDERFGRDSPSLVDVRKALDDCRKLLIPILNAKREREPDESPPADQTPADDGVPAEHEPHGDEGPTLAAPARLHRGASAAGPIGDIADAHRRIVEAAAYLRQHDRGSPVPFLVVRALRFAEVFALPRPLDPSSLPAPATEARQALKRLAAEGSWGELLEAAEQALGRPEGRAWLDAHRLAIRAMEAADDLPAAAATSRGFLRAFLAEFPELPRSELDDDTPAASSETRSWLDAEILPRPGAAPEPAPQTEALPPFPDRPEPGPDPADAEPDAWDRALDLAASGRLADGLQILRRSLGAAPTGRGRFLRKLQMAELCLRADHPGVALPLLDDLAGQVDEFRLDQWEDEHLIARVWGSLYRCLRTSGGAETSERLRLVHARLCRLDINQALAYENPA